MKKIYTKRRENLENMTEEELFKTLDAHTERILNNEDEIFHCLAFQMSWSFSKVLSDKCIQELESSLLSCAQKHKFTIHESDITNKKISFVVQTNPFVSVEDVFLLFQRTLATDLTKNHPDIDAKTIWLDDAVIESASCLW